MVYLITRFYRVRAENRDEAVKWLNKAIREGREHVYCIGEALRVETRKSIPWFVSLAQEFTRQLRLLIRGTRW